MGVVTRRPNSISLDGPFTSLEGGGGAGSLGDQNDNTFVSLKTLGTVRTSYPTLSAGSIPSGRKIIAPRVVHRYNYAALRWVLPGLRAPESYILRQGQRIASSKLFALDPAALEGNVNQAGPALVKDDYTPWTLAEINELSTEHLSRAWVLDYMDLTDVGIDVIYSEPFGGTLPSAIYPADNATVDSSNVNFSVKMSAPQDLQAVRAVFQVARDAAFTSSLKTFYSSFSYDTSGTARVTYSGVSNTPSDTDLGPGKWYIRAKGSDVVSQETGWTATTSFNVVHAPMPVPTGLTDPTPGGIVTTPYGVRTAKLAAFPSASRLFGIEFNFSKSNNFTAPLVTKTTSLQISSTTVSYDSEGDPAQYLAQSIWFARARSVDKWGQYSAWSPTQSFSVSHPPLAINTYPSANQVIDQDKTPFSWTFADSWNGDAQTAYQVKIYDEFNTLIKDSGKVASANARTYAPALANSYRFRPGLRWTVQLWDSDDATRTVITNNYFKLSLSPQVVLPYPAQNETVLTGRPTISWTPGINAPAFQKKYFLQIRQAADNLVVFQREETSTLTSVLPPQIILKNLTNYILTLRVDDSDGLSTLITRNFRAEYQAPPDVNFTVDFDAYSRLGYVDIDWSVFAPDATFIEWRVYRREAGMIDWELLLVDPNSSHRTYQDWMVPSVNFYQYMVTQVADRSGYSLESYLDPNIPQGYVASEDYWLLVPDNLPTSCRLYSVTGDSFNDEVEMKVETIIGRGRRVNYGTRIGISGTLSVALRDSSLTAREQQRAIREIQDSMKAVILRDPFGGLTKIALGESIGYDRMPGVGNREFADVSIPYMEVS